MEEIVCPRARDFAFATDSGFTKDQILEMENEVLLVLEYKLTPITLNQIVNYILEKWDLFVEQNPLKL